MLANPPGTGGQCQKWLLQFALSGSRCANYKRAIGDRLGDASVLLRGLEGRTLRQLRSGLRETPVHRDLPVAAARNRSCSSHGLRRRYSADFELIPALQTNDWFLEPGARSYSAVERPYSFHVTFCRVTGRLSSRIAEANAQSVISASPVVYEPVRVLRYPKT